jgi:hypothetical protein
LRERTNGGRSLLIDVRKRIFISWRRGCSLGFDFMEFT